jgi:outer membrane immunogenic protein
MVAIMKKRLWISLSALFTATIVSPVLAADIPSRKAAPVYAQPIATWTGFYAGLNAGGMWGNNANINTVGYPLYARPASAATTIPVAFGAAYGLSANNTTSANPGFIGGAQLGYNKKFGSAVVALEADIQGSLGGNQNANAAWRAYDYNYYSLAVGANLTNRMRVYTSGSKSVDYLGTFRGKIGYLITPNILLYGTGGLAYGGATLKYPQILCDISELTDEAWLNRSATNKLQVGWTAGGGWEWMFLENLSAKAEYLYYDLGSLQMYGGTALQFRNSVPPVGQGTPPGTLATIIGQNVFSRITGNIVRAGVNYHFNWGTALVVASY